MYNQQSSYSRWTWIVAIILVLILVWMLLSGRGPSSSCCSTPLIPVASNATPITAEPFGFSASCKEINNKGNAVAWLADASQLQSILCAEEGLKAEGDDQHVTLTGTIDSEASKTKVAEDVQAFFGQAYSVNNQITVKAAEPLATQNPPAAAKLYFDTGKSSLPSEAQNTIAPIVDWLKVHPESKAVISGFHDAKGSQQINHEIAKARAKSTYDALIAAGVDANKIEMRKPSETLGTGDLDEARRVEVSVE
jgi:cytochrome c oxidase subunit II